MNDSDSALDLPSFGELRVRLGLAITRQERYKPFGETLWSAGTNTPTTQTYTGQKRESSFGLYDYNARWYDSAIGRFTQADTIVPSPASAKAFDRYAYVENNPIRYSDPSGHDPLGSDWQAAFKRITGRQPDQNDIAIRLFSYAFPTEWALVKNKFYNADWSLNVTEFASIFYNGNQATRNWSNMPDILANLAQQYKPWENWAYVRDVATLFAGITDRFRSPFDEVALYQAQEGQRNTISIYMTQNSLPPGLDLDSGSDLDGNVHHWAAYLLTGFTAQRKSAIGVILSPVLVLGVNVARSLNLAREIWGADGANPNDFAWDDLYLGDRASVMGAGLSMSPLTTSTVRFWYFETMTFKFY
jgi:RHS repeat-associated protein